MKVNNKYLFPFVVFVLMVVSLLITSCTKREYHVEYKIDNSSSRSLNIIYKRPLSPEPDTNLINPGRSLIFFIESGTDKPVQKYLDNLQQLPVEYIEVTDLDENQAVCVMDLSCWKKWANNKDEGLGEVILSISNSTEFE